MTNSQYETVNQTKTQEVRKYKPFDGSILKSMPALIREGRVPIMPDEVMEVRLPQSNKGSPADKEEMRDNYIDTSLSVIPNPHGDEIKLVHELPLIYGLNPNTKLNSNYALDVSQDTYDEADGLILTGNEVREFMNNKYALPNKRREVFEFFAKGKTKLAQDYEKHVCEETGKTFDNVQGLWLTSSKGLRLLCVIVKVINFRII